jgi:predicted CoA-substrate-specific enzyme activase
MTLTAGIDVGSTYTKALILDEGHALLGRFMMPTGFELAAAAARALREAAAKAGIAVGDVTCVVSTGFGRHQVPFADIAVTDLTAAARGATALYPGTRTILDVGGQTMKASGLTDEARVKAFRLNDKCAAGTGAFLEKTARYMGFSTEEIGPLVATSKAPVPISGVCAVFAESEVINQLSQGSAPADIMQGAVISLVGRSVQLMKRVRMEPEFTLIGGILRFSTMVDVIRRELDAPVNVPEGDLVQYVAAYGAAVLGQRRLRRLREEGGEARPAAPLPA